MNEILGKIWKKTPRFVRRGIVVLTQQRFTASVGAVVVNSQNKILLLDHVLRPGSGWGVPGGFIDYGEQPEQALRRELMEETGLELDFVEMSFVRTVHRHIEVIFFAKTTGTPEVRSSEIRSAEWFDRSELHGILNRSQRKIIEKVLSNSSAAEPKNRSAELQT